MPPHMPTTTSTAADDQHDMPPDVFTRTWRGVGLQEAAGSPELSVRFFFALAVSDACDPIRAAVPRPAARTGADTRFVR